MEEKNIKLLDSKKTYPGVLVKVISDYDYVREVNVVRFVYKVYLDKFQTIEVMENIYFWDNPRCRMGSMKKLNRILESYNLELLPKDYRNELSLVNSLKWLVGTRVEIKKYNYKGIKFRVIYTERNNAFRVNNLWMQIKEPEFEIWF